MKTDADVEKHGVRVMNSIGALVWAIQDWNNNRLISKGCNSVHISWTSPNLSLFMFGVWGHPLSTYTPRGRGGGGPKAYVVREVA